MVLEEAGRTPKENLYSEVSRHPVNAVCVHIGPDVQEGKRRKNAPHHRQPLADQAQHEHPQRHAHQGGRSFLQEASQCLDL